jgi:RNA recognition motif-containing protein
MRSGTLMRRSSVSICVRWSVDVSASERELILVLTCFSIVRNPDGEPRGSAFVEFADQETATNAMNALNGKEVESGTQLTVRYGKTDAQKRVNRPNRSTRDSNFANRRQPLSERLNALSPEDESYRGRKGEGLQNIFRPVGSREYKSGGMRAGRDEAHDDSHYDGAGNSDAYEEEGDGRRGAEAYGRR